MATPLKDENSVKCVAIGDAAVGKTCLLISYTTNKFPAEYVPTVFDNYETRVEVNNEWYVFQLWDTAGSEHYDVLRPLSYSDTDVFLVCYSVVDRESFDNVETKWIKDIKEKGDKDVPVIIVGNKVDLRGNEPAAKGKDKPVTKAEGEKLKSKVDAALFFEVSALTQEGLKETFDGAMRLAFKRARDRKQAKEGALSKKEESHKEPVTCCIIA